MALNINGTTGISGVDGSASAPALQGTDSNTGINFASDTVNINTGGSTRATIDSSGNLNIPNDSGKIQLGTGNDLEVFHNGTNSHLRNQTGDFIIDSNSSGSVKLRPKIGEEGVVANTDGSVDLYHDGSKKFETISSGATVTGDLGIGTTNPSGEAINGAQNFVIYDTTSDGGMSIKSGTSGNGQIHFSDTSANGQGRLIYAHSNDSMQMYTAGSERMRIDSSGNTIIGGTAVAAQKAITFEPDRDSGAGRITTNRANSGSNAVSIVWEMQNAGSQVGRIEHDNTSAGIVSGSDYRLKENDVVISDGITRVKQLRPIRFNWKTEPSKTLDGFFAHEVQGIVPEAVSGEKDAVDSDGKIIMQGMVTERLIPLLTAALQEAVAKIEVLETKVAALEAA